MKLIGLSPKSIFSGFENTFFNSVEMHGAKITRLEVEVPFFKLLCTLKSFHPNKKKWGLRRDLAYHASIKAFQTKSRFVQKHIKQLQNKADAIYQIGSLWNPLGPDIDLPFFMHVSYTSMLSKKRGAEWKREPGREQEFWLEQEKKLYDSAIKVFTTTENARRSIIDDYDISPDKVVAVGAGVSPPYDEIDHERKPDYSSRKIYFVGKGFKGKGLDTLLEAFKLVRAEIPDAGLTVVGPTNEDIKGPGVEYLGRINDRNRVKEMYYQHALYVMPSIFEPLGQVFIEAMSCKLPIIGTTLDAMPELIDHGKTGYIIEPGDDQTLAKYIIGVLKDPQLAADLGKCGYEKLMANYTWPIVGKKTFDNIAASGIELNRSS